MKRYMLDANTVSHLLKRQPDVTRRVMATPLASLCISAITKGELLFGLAKRPDAKRLHAAVQELFKRVDVLPWDSATAERYGPVRAELERRGQMLGPLDLLIATHALTEGAALVTNDHAFAQVGGLELEDWTQP